MRNRLQCSVRAIMIIISLKISRTLTQNQTVQDITLLFSSINGGNDYLDIAGVNEERKLIMRCWRRGCAMMRTT